MHGDDILRIRNDVPKLQSVKAYHGKYLSMKDLRDVTPILGIKIFGVRSKRLIGFSQCTYLDCILKKFKMQDSRKGLVSMQHVTILSKTRCLSSSEELDTMNQVSYAFAI